MGDSVGRVAVVAGLRTPFAKQMTHFRGYSAVQMAIPLVHELLCRTGIKPALVQRLVFGSALTLPDAQNVARDIVLHSKLPATIDAYSVSRACATSLQAVMEIAWAIGCNDIQIGVAGGADSTSVVPITLQDLLADALLFSSKQKHFLAKLRAFSALRWRHLAPRAPAVRDSATGLRMGDAAEQMARDYAITRQAQDEFTLRSHRLASQAWEMHAFSEQVMPFHLLSSNRCVLQDNVVRNNVSLGQLQDLKPAFDKPYGSVTAGNSSALTDGAAAILLMSEEKADSLGLAPLGFIKSHAFVAHNAASHMLMGPSFATPLALNRAGLTLNDIDVIEMHEAFAAQVLANLMAFESPLFARRFLNRDHPIGAVDMDKFNLQGGSLAYGHPFAATGARMIVQALSLLRQRGEQFALVTACAAGGLGASIVLEAAP